MLKQKVGKSKITLVAMTFAANGKFMGGNFRDDSYLSDTELKKIDEFSDEEAVEMAREYILKNEDVVENTKKALEKEYAKIDFALRQGRVFKIVNFKKEVSGIEYGYVVYFDAIEKKVLFADCLK